MRFSQPTFLAVALVATAAVTVAHQQSKFVLVPKKPIIVKVGSPAGPPQSNGGNVGSTKDKNIQDAQQSIGSQLKSVADDIQITPLNPCPNGGFLSVTNAFSTVSFSNGWWSFIGKGTMSGVINVPTGTSYALLTVNGKWTSGSKDIAVKIDQTTSTLPWKKGGPDTFHHLVIMDVKASSKASFTIFADGANVGTITINSVDVQFMK